jgi:tetratricopeptide (TPR) repeat protein
MKKTLLLLAALAAFGCAGIRDLGKDDAPYANPFYAKYLTSGSGLDASINRALTGLRANPDSPELHNELGMLLVQKGFPKDAEREFERAVDSDGRYFPAWYNLGLVRAASGQEDGARRAFRRTVKHKPGHAMALFQLGLIEEKLLHTDRAIDYYAKAYSINPALMQVSVNPRVLDSRLMDLALIRMYPTAHARRSMNFQGAPSAPARQTPQAPSPQADPQQIVPPSAPATDPSQQNPNRPPG